MIRDKRIAIVHWALVLFAVLLVGRAAKVQLWERKKWVALASRQHFRASDHPAPRGPILDASGAPLAQSREMVRLSVAPLEVRDPKRLARLLGEVGVSAQWTRRITSGKQKWVDLPGRFLASDIATIAALRGVYPRPVGERVYASSDGLRRVIGRTNGDGSAVDGIELTLDSILRGETGRTRVARDARGRSYDAPGTTSDAPETGHTVSLTINKTLQDITDRALADAVARMSASGGDIVVVDPNSGEVLAMSSYRSVAGSTGATALTEPFQPGSTLKPFIASALLVHGRARPDEVIETYNGRYATNGRVITDVHAAPRLSLSDVIRHSSNVGIVRFAERLTPREQYESLRDFGFGMPTGLPYPSEAAGTLREPKHWSKQSAASIAIGYEIAVTPLQLAMAYAAIANGGELLAPAIVKEIRAPGGELRYRHERRVLRRVSSPEIAAQLRKMLVGVVDSGTATDADLKTFEVGGKSGTARGMQGRRYVAGSYTATFVGLFPAERPQYVILVKLDNPVGAYYGGKTAAPVSKVVLQAAIAARDAALDRGALAARRRVGTPPRNGRAPAQLASRTEVPVIDSAPHKHPDSPAVVPSRAVPLVVDLSERLTEKPAPARVIPVPDVRGLTLRGAVHRLHEVGFRVELVAGAPGTTFPAAGSPVRAGSIIRLAQ